MKYLLIFCSLINFAYAQKKHQSSYTVYLNDITGSLKAEVVLENRELKVDDRLTYYWYSSNKILLTKGGYDGKLLSGNYSSYYLSNSLKEKGVFSNGLKDKQWRAWYENGNLKEICDWNDGLKDGRNKKFSAAGNLISETSYSKGLLHGNEIIYEGDKVVSKKKYKHGVEVLPKVSKKTAMDSTSKPRASLFDRFSKKEVKKEKRDEKNADGKKVQEKRAEENSGPGINKNKPDKKKLERVSKEPPLASRSEKKQRSSQRWSKFKKRKTKQDEVASNEKKQKK